MDSEPVINVASTNAKSDCISNEQQVKVINSDHNRAPASRFGHTILFTGSEPFASFSGEQREMMANMTALPYVYRHTVVSRSAHVLLMSDGFGVASQPVSTATGSLVLRDRKTGVQFLLVNSHALSAKKEAIVYNPQQPIAVHSPSTEMLAIKIRILADQEFPDTDWIQE
ncbi:hypothetical protein BJ508DRAFT_313444 [Ascobolus immersus RN42]|uniref:Uncharacterized protein n=1 Tax=Ascobolus immersus RN42 TaxID=1160509 RepID=A0A3N4HLM9_ASCIM|nr:hypothetical protein BJ508DRAFT_313444 [Ascobolus immersus RN42]